MKTKITEKNFKRVTKLVAKGIQDRLSALCWDHDRVEVVYGGNFSYGLVKVWNEKDSFMTDCLYELVKEQVCAWNVRYDRVSITIATRPITKELNGEWYTIYTPMIEVYIG
jgi:hypothetical protein